MPSCSVARCERDVVARGWCSAHYQEWRAHGRVTQRLDLTGRILTNVDVADGGCWLWQGTLDSKGYGRLWYDGRWGLAHRASYERLAAEIPEGLELDHLCRTPACVNPDHLEPVTHAENMRRAVYDLPTHCVNGHAFTPENTYRPPKRPNARHCRACNRSRTAAWAKRKAV